MSAIWESANWTRQFGIRQTGNRQFGIRQTGNRQFGMLPFTYPDILHTGKKVRLQIRIDHKMFDMFTSRNVNKIFKYPLSRPTTMSDQIVGFREC